MIEQKERLFAAPNDVSLQPQTFTLQGLMKGESDQVPMKA